MNFPLEIVIEYGSFHHIKVTIFKDGTRMSPFSPGLSSALRQLAKQSGAYQSVEDELLRALEPIETPVRIRFVRKTTTTAIWDSMAFYDLRWGLNISASQSVEIRQEALDINGSSCVVLPIGKHLVIDITNQKVGRVRRRAEGNSVDIQYKFRKTRSGGLGQEPTTDSLVTSSKLYNQTPLVFDALSDLTDIRFSVLDASQTPQIISPSYSINIAPHPSDSTLCILQPIVSIGGDTFSLFECSTDVAESLFELPVAISTQAWRRALFIAFGNAIKDSNLSSEQVVSSIDLGTIPILPPQQIAAIETVEKWLALQNSYSITAFAGSSWHFVELDWAAQSIAITASILAHSEVSFDDGGFAAPSEVIHQIAETLVTQLGGTGIELRWNQTPLHFESWDIQATLTDDGENYVLEPVVQFMGQPIRMENWDSILDLNGVQVGDRDAIMLSNETIEALRALVKYKPNVSDDKTSRSPIVLSGRLRILDILYLVKNGVRIALSDADRELVDSLSHFVTLQSVALPADFTGSLREYQKAGFDWLCFLYRHRFGACLADDMGLGKTIQAIAFLAWVVENSPSSCCLVVVPPSLVYNWRKELERFAPKLSVHEYTGAKRELKKDGVNILITTYDIVRRDVDTMTSNKFDVIVYDEAQIIKNMMASRSAAVRKLSGRFSVCLTGTPLENHAGEFVSILELAVPGLTEGIGSRNDATIAMLVERARPFVMRRTKEKILKELPEKIESTVYLPLCKTQQAYYKKIVTEVREQVQQMFEKYKSGRAGLLAITALLRLRQLCISPTLIDATYAVMSPKMDYLIETLTELQSEGHSSLVFTQFRSFAELLVPQFEKHGIRFIQIDGQTRMSDRKKLIEEFQTSDQPMVALMTLKTGGIGLNLIKASYVFHVDPWWNPAAENQASDRAHRIGQVQKVNVIRLIMQDSIEERVLKLKEEKQFLFDEIVNKGLSRGKNAALSREDFNFLLT